jgi:hypothetical protein
MKPFLIKYVALLITVIVQYACTITTNDKPSINGNRDYTKIARPISAFNELEIKGDFDIELISNIDFKLVIDADSNLHNFIYTEAHNNRLIISQPENRRLKSFRRIKVTIEAPIFTKLIMSGQNRIESNQPIEFDTLRWEIFGATTTNLILKGQHLSGLFPGAVDMALQGNVASANLQFPGAVKLDASKLITKQFLLKIQGAGKASVHATQELDVEIAGAGIVTYSGNPAIINSSIGGIGKLIRN